MSATNPRKTPQLIDRYATSPELRAAIATYCRRHGLTHSQFVRMSIAEKLGKAGLVETVGSAGRPVKKPIAVKKKRAGSAT